MNHLRFLHTLLIFLTNPVHGDPGDSWWRAWRKYRLTIPQAWDLAYRCDYWRP